MGAIHQVGLPHSNGLARAGYSDGTGRFLLTVRTQSVRRGSRIRGGSHRACVAPTIAVGSSKGRALSYLRGGNGNGHVRLPNV